jgi:hypothetical protein
MGARSISAMNCTTIRMFWNGDKKTNEAGVGFLSHIQIAYKQGIAGYVTVYAARR